MSIVNLAGAIDLHIHSNPSLFKRTGSDLDIANHAAENQLSAVLLKNHFESTVGRASIANDAVQGTEVFGGLVLNHFSGGLNPSAVETSIRLGAKQIWMPTIDALGHADAFGHTGGYGYQESNSQISRSGIAILNEDGELVEEIETIVELAKASDVILGTAHLSQDEIFKLAEFCDDLGFAKLLITHPYFDPPRLGVAEQAKLYELGATIELCGGNLYPIPGTAKLSDYLGSISKLGARAFVISSDAGQPRKSMPAEVLRVFSQCLLEKGVTQEELDIMTKENPRRLLNL